METDLSLKQAQAASSAIQQPDTLLLAIGNSARQDDGLGWAFMKALQQTNRFQGQLQACYQLQIEDAELITRFPRVIFVDATSESLPDGFSWENVRPQNDFTFTTHALTPMAVLYLCQDLYNKHPEAYLLKIQGEQWELQTGLSPNAKENLNKAIHFFAQLQVGTKPIKQES